MKFFIAFSIIIGLTYVQGQEKITENLSPYSFIKSGGNIIDRCSNLALIGADYAPAHAGGGKRNLKLNGSVVDFDIVTSTAPRDQISAAVLSAIDGGIDFEVEQSATLEDGTAAMIIQDLTRDGMTLSYVAGDELLQEKFHVKNNFLVDDPDYVFLVECPAQSDGDTCKVSREDSCFQIDDTIPSKCMDNHYNVGLYYIPGPHFLIGATSAGGNDDGECPAVIGFEALNGQKEKFGMRDAGDIQDLPVQFIGSATLDDIINAERSAEVPNFLDPLTDGCAHYARSIWRSLEFPETNELADFFVDKIAEDDGFEHVLNKHFGRFRYLLAKATGSEKWMNNYLEEIVYSQLTID